MAWAIASAVSGYAATASATTPSAATRSASGRVSTRQALRTLIWSPSTRASGVLIITTGTTRPYRMMASSTGHSTVTSRPV